MSLFQPIPAAVFSDSLNIKRGPGCPSATTVDTDSLRAAEARAGVGCGTLGGIVVSFAGEVTAICSRTDFFSAGAADGFMGADTVGFAASFACWGCGPSRPQPEISRDIRKAREVVRMVCSVEVIAVHDTRRQMLAQATRGDIDDINVQTFSTTTFVGPWGCADFT
jgi:hypothetical protein